MDLHWKFPYRILYPLASSRKFHESPVKSKAYQQYLIENEAPESQLLFAGGKTSVESGFQIDRYRAKRVSKQNRCVLMTKDVILDDTSMYH
ncbi:T-cell receptor gamma chain V domain [Aix galericulata]|nr:T-cell receptor gamma chain V domain [Aix galericulata]